MLDSVIEAGGKTFVVRFSQNALFLLEQHLESMEDDNRRAGHAAKTRIERSGGRDVVVEISGMDLLKELPTNVSMQLLFWAGLEGARLKNRDRAQPYTVYEAGDIIDEVGGIDQIMIPVSRAYALAFPQRFPPNYVATLDELAEAQQKALAELASSGSRPDPNAKEDESTGTGSSSKSRKRK